MATASSGKAEVGTIKVVIGDVKVIGVDGVARMAQVGDKVFAKEVIQTSANAIVQVQLEDGRMLDLGRNSSIALDDDILSAGVGALPVVPAAPVSQDIAAIQAQIAAGADPSKVAEATAAGGTPGAGGADGSGGTPVVIDQANSSGAVTSGFQTGPAGIAFPNNVSLPLLSTVGPVVSVAFQGQTGVTVQQGVNVSGDAASLLEGTGAGVRVLIVVVTLDHAYAQNVAITYQIVPGAAAVISDLPPGMATPGVDFTGVLSGTIVIPAGQTRFVIPVSIIQDGLVEPDESFRIVLTGASNGATIDPSHSTATVVIINDDVAPVATPDTNWIQENDNTTVGNVLTNADHPGAPSGSFADHRDTGSNPLLVEVVSTFHGQYGDLFINATGAYTYVLNNQNPAVDALLDGETLTDTFVYTANDGINTGSNATLAITIFGSTKEPVVVAPAPAFVSEEGLPGGLPDNIGFVTDTTDSTVASGTVPITNPNPMGLPLTVTLGVPSDALTSAGEPIQWSLSPDGKTLTGAVVVGDGGEGSFNTPIIVVTINDTGNYTVNLLGPIDHPSTTQEDQLLFGVTVSVFNPVGISPDGTEGPTTSTTTLTIVVEDDSPVVTVVEEGGEGGQSFVPTLTVDESDFGGNASAWFGGNFNFDGGADGLASVQYQLNITLGSTGLKDTATNEDIVLVMNGGVVEGRAAFSNHLVFTVGVDSSGVVTLDQVRAIVHADPTNPNDAVTLPADFIRLSLVVTDNDGDNRSATIPIGESLVFHDDGPTINALTDFVEPQLTVDETVLAANATASFAGLFSSTFGADGAGEISYALGTPGGESGVTDVATGNAVFLFVEAGQVVGRAGANAAAAVTGDVVFTVSVDATGNVTLDQLRAISHADATDPNDSRGLLLADMVTLTATVKDADGDTQSASQDIGGSLQFFDDGPVAAGDAYSVEEDGTLTITAAALLGNGDSLGADGGVLAVTGFTQPGNGILVQNPDGSFTYTPAANYSGSDSFTYTITDADGDTATATVGITVNAADDVPVAVDDTYSVNEDNTLTITAPGVLGNGDTTGGDGGPLTVTSFTNPSNGVLVLNPDGSFGYTPNANYNGVDSFTYTITDADGQTDTATVTINVNPVNDLPVALADSNWVSEDTVVSASGNVLVTQAHSGAPSGVFGDVADTDIDAGQTLTVATAGTLNGAYGQLVLNADGSYTYTLYTQAQNAAAYAAVQARNAADAPLVDTFNYGTTDGTATANATLAISVFGTDDNSAPTLSVQAGDSTVFESGLPAGSNAAANSETTSGAFTVADTDGLGDIHSITIGGTTLTVGAGAGEFASLSAMVGQVVDTGYGTLTLTGYTNGQFSYGYTLDTKVDNDSQAGATNANYIEQIPLSVSDGTASANAMINVTINDDAPVAVNSTRTGQADVGAQTNLTLVLDVSSSMVANVESMGMTRIHAEKLAAIELIEQYEALGNVKISIVTFNHEATSQGYWMTATDAKAAIMGISEQVVGSTNYQAGVDVARQGYEVAANHANLIPGAQNMLYFLSDGQPNPVSTGLTGGEVTSWQNFLNTNDIRTFALGMGPDVSATELNPIAYDGNGAGTNRDATDVIMVSDFAQLSQTLVSTVQSLPVSGNVITDNLGATFGADGGWVQAIKTITVNGAVYTFDPSIGPAVTGGPSNGSFNAVTHEWTVATEAGGSIKMDMDTGVYTYTPPVAISGNIAESIGFTLADNDGDTASATLAIHINFDGTSVLVVRDDIVLTNQVAAPGPDQIVIPDWALLANDSGGSGTPAVTAVDSAASGSISHVGSNVIFTENSSASTNGGSFSYTNTTGSASDDGHVQVNRTATAGVLEGTTGGDILLGREGSNDVINGDGGPGAGGNDILFGLGGDDRLFGDAGNDILVGGTGSDKMTGGTGADTFMWRNGDQNAVSTPVDTITDFTQSPGDKLNLSDLLQGEHANAGSLTSYLHFSFAGGDTTIDVKSAGGAGAVDQKIVLQGVDLTAGNTLSDSAIITNLLTQTKLQTDI